MNNFIIKVIVFAVFNILIVNCGGDQCQRIEDGSRATCMMALGMYPGCRQNELEGSRVSSWSCDSLLMACWNHYININDHCEPSPYY